MDFGRIALDVSDLCRCQSCQRQGGAGGDERRENHGIAGIDPRFYHRQKLVQSKRNFAITSRKFLFRIGEADTMTLTYACDLWP